MDPDLPLSNAAFTLIRLSTLVNSACEDAGMTTSQFRFLAFVVQTGARVGDLARLLGVSMAAVSQTADILADRGWLRREVVLDDRRGTRLVVTRAGLVAMTKVEHRVDWRVRDLLGDELADELLAWLPSMDPIMDTELARLMGTPVVQGAVDTA